MQGPGGKICDSEHRPRRQSAPQGAHGRNPQTGEAIKIKAKTVVRLRAAKAFKDSVLK